MSLTAQYCPECGTDQVKPHTSYQVLSGERRWIYHCPGCEAYFSETKNTPLAGLKTPVSQMATILNAINDGMGLNAACRTFKVGKNSIKRWLSRLGGLQETLLLYALCHQFIQQRVEGDELYTKVGQNLPAALSEGWTVVLMDRASHLIWALECGQRQTDLFEQAIQTLSQVVEQTADLTLLTDGERRYGNLLFAMCHELVHTGQVGRPKKHLSLA